MLAALAIAAVACKPDGAGKPMTLRIGITQWPGFDIVHHARKQGYFESRGLDVQWKSFDKQQDVSRAVLLGSLDAAFVSIWDTIQMAPNDQAAAVILVTDVSRGADGIVARPGIASMAELRGKRVAVKLGTISQLILLEALTLHRMTPDDIQIVDIDDELAERRMYDGSIDAVVTWEPTLSRIAARTGGSIHYTTREVDSMTVDGVAACEQALREKPEALIRLLLVWFDVMHDLETRPDQVYANAGAAIRAHPLGSTARGDLARHDRPRPGRRPRPLPGRGHGRVHRQAVSPRGPDRGPRPLPRPRTRRYWCVITIMSSS